MMNLPLELLVQIALCDEQSYRSMVLALPIVSRFFKPDDILNNKVLFGYNVNVIKIPNTTITYIRWTRNGVTHRSDGPAIIYENGFHSYVRNGRVFLKSRS